MLGVLAGHAQASARARPCSRAVAPHRRLVARWLLMLVSPSGMPQLPLPEQVRQVGAHRHTQALTRRNAPTPPALACIALTLIPRCPPCCTHLHSCRAPSRGVAARRPAGAAVVCAAARVAGGGPGRVAAVRDAHAAAAAGGAAPGRADAVHGRVHGQPRLHPQPIPAQQAERGGARVAAERHARHQLRQQVRGGAASVCDEHTVLCCACLCCSGFCCCSDYLSLSSSPSLFQHTSHCDRPCVTPAPRRRASALDASLAPLFSADPLVLGHLVPALLQLYTDVEHTDRANQFYQKFTMRQVRAPAVVGACWQSLGALMVVKRWPRGALAAPAAAARTSTTGAAARSGLAGVCARRCCPPACSAFAHRVHTACTTPQHHHPATNTTTAATAVHRRHPDVRVAAAGAPPGVGGVRGARRRARPVPALCQHAHQRLHLAAGRGDEEAAGAAPPALQGRARVHAMLHAACTPSAPLPAGMQCTHELQRLRPQRPTHARHTHAHTHARHACAARVRRSCASWRAGSRRA